MVQGFTDKDGKFRPTGSRSPISLSITGQPISGQVVREALPKKPEEIESKRRGEFAKERAKQFAKLGAKATVKGLLKGAKAGVAGIKTAQQKKVQKSIEEQERIEDLDREIDAIVDSDRSDSSKFRLLQRFGILQGRNLSKHQLRIVNDALMELDIKVKKSGMTERVIPVDKPAPAPAPQTVTIKIPQSTPPIMPTGQDFKKEGEKVKTEGLSAQEFEKLPSMLKQQIIALGGSGR